MSSRIRLILAAAVAGVVAGFLWGIADQPRYSAAATLIASGPNGGPANPADLARYAELGASERVAVGAAGLLGDDAAGADLLSDVEFVPGADGATLIVTAGSELPDFAAASADAFADALIVVTDDALRERLRSKRSEIEPGSDEAIALEERISDLRTPGVGGPLSNGAAAAIPDAASTNRSAILWAAIGLAAGLLLGLLMAFLIGRRAGDPARSKADPKADGPLSAAFGVPLLGRVDERGGGAPASGPGEIRLHADRAAIFERLAAAIGLGSAGAPRTLAFLDVASGGRADAIGTGVAIAAAELGLKVVIVEADLAAPSLAARHRVNASPGLRDYLDGRATPREVLRRVRAEVDGGGPIPLVCVPAGEPNDSSLITIAGGRFESLVERLPRVYDLVVFEAPPLHSGAEAEVVARLVDGIVLVATEAEASRADIQRRIELLESGPLLGSVLIGDGDV